MAEPLDLRAIAARLAAAKHPHSHTGTSDVTCRTCQAVEELHQFAFVDVSRLLAALRALRHQARLVVKTLGTEDTVVQELADVLDQVRDDA